MSSAAALECSPIRFGSLDAIICPIDIRTHRLQLFHRDAKGQPLKSFRSLELLLEERGEALSFGMNAGMFHADFSPVGLLVSEGQEVQPLNLSSGEGNFFLLPNGVFLVGASGAHVVESSQYPGFREGVFLATQSGPLLVHEGEIHAAFSPDGNSTTVRNGVGVIDEHHVVFAITEDAVSLHEFALLFRDHLNCRNALYLDGSISSLFANNLDRRDAMHSFGPILAVTMPKRRGGE